MMPTDELIKCLRELAKGADFTLRNILRMAANRLEQLQREVRGDKE